MHYSANRSCATAEFLFDGYPGYNSVANKEGVTQLGCWAHVRRKFTDIIKSGASDEVSKKYAQELVGIVAQLYKIEKEIKDDPPDPTLYKYIGPNGELRDFAKRVLEVTN